MKFVGNYPEQVRSVLTASALAGVHAIILGPPGWGKTSLALACARALGGLGGYVVIRLDPATPPARIQGAYDPAAILQGRLERVLEGTPYAPGVQVVVLDEIFRANEVVFDALLDVLDRLDLEPDQAPVVWATSNFVAQGERLAALKDRFALWLWLEPELVDAAAVARSRLASLGRHLDADGLPDWEAVAEIRSLRPGPETERAVAEAVSALAAEAQAQGLRPNPRHLAWWAQTLFRVGAYHAGASFREVPEEAKKLLRYVWPASSPEEAAAWAQVAGAIVDPVAAAIEAVLAEALRKFREVASVADPAQRAARISDLGVALASAQASLQQLGDDARAAEALQTLTAWFAAAVRGEVPR